MGKISFMTTAQTGSSYFLDPTNLNHKAAELHEGYVSAEPFPHAVMDDFLPAWATEKILNEFPDIFAIDWSRYDHEHSKKLATDKESHMGEFTRAAIHQFNSAPFLDFLSKLSGIENLIADPYLWGGGLHQITRGGFLNMHADFNRYKRLGLDRRLNFLLYLNKDWKEDYGGHLELWDKSMKHCVKKVLPVFNRAVVFSTTSTSYHGHPVPLTCPENASRKSLALYYYTNGRPEHERREEHNTLYRKTPEQKKHENKTGKPLYRRVIDRAKAWFKV